jgi:hypothetical protein
MPIDILFYFIVCNTLNGPGFTQLQMVGRIGKNVKEDNGLPL